MFPHKHPQLLQENSPSNSSIPVQQPQVLSWSEQLSPEPSRWRWLSSQPCFGFQTLLHFTGFTLHFSRIHSFKSKTHIISLCILPWLYLNGSTSFRRIRSRRIRSRRIWSRRIWSRRIRSRRIRSCRIWSRCIWLHLIRSRPWSCRIRSRRIRSRRIAFRRIRSRRIWSRRIRYRRIAFRRTALFRPID